MDEPKYVRIKFKEILQEFVDGYNLKEYIHTGWVYFEIVKGCYGLPQAGRLANVLLRKRLAKEGYYEAEIPGLWKHESRPIQFVLVVDDTFCRVCRQKTC